MKEGQPINHEKEAKEESKKEKVRKELKDLEKGSWHVFGFPRLGRLVRFRDFKEALEKDVEEVDKIIAERERLGKPVKQALNPFSQAFKEIRDQMQDGYRKELEEEEKEYLHCKATDCDSIRLVENHRPGHKSSMESHIALCCEDCGVWSVYKREEYEGRRIPPPLQPDQGATGDSGEI